MKQQIRKFCISNSLGLLLAVSAYPAMADDTDIFVKRSSSTADQPNILFVVDNSGSMREEDVLTRSEVYDPNKGYNAGGFDTNRWYFSPGAKPEVNNRRAFPTNISFCKGMADLISTTGKYEGKLIGLFDGTSRWTQGRSGWRNLDYRWDRSLRGVFKAIECEVDWGEHGQTDASTKVYPTDETGASIDNLGVAWETSESDAVDYNSRSTYGGLYSGHYMNYLEVTPVTTSSRMEAVKSVLTDIVGSMNGVNFGLMSFNVNSRGTTNGGNIDYPVKDIAQERQGLKDRIKLYQPTTNTPLGETLYEATRYFKGDTVDAGVFSVSAAKSGGRYISPITNECQGNAIIYLTDGEPTQDYQLDNRIGNYIGKSCEGDNCLDDVAGYLADNDMRTGAGFDGVQNVKTYTVGFKADFPLLEDAAKAGKGEYFKVTDTDKLVLAIQSIIKKITEQGTTFTAPGISVNFFGSLENNNEIYYSLFQPEGDDRWPGNLKRYKIGFNNGVAEIQDSEDSPAINPDNGRILNSAKSAWSPIADGSEVGDGGAASQLELPRNVLTYIGNSSLSQTLSQDSNKIRKQNTLITQAMLGAPTNAERDKILDFAIGVDVRDDNNNKDFTDLLTRVGDPLHSQPSVVQYKKSGTESTVIFFGTNEGYIHAIDAEDGDEVFAFMPQELLPNIKTYLDEASLGANKNYGIDSEIEIWVNDLNGDGYIREPDGSLQSGESAYLYAGMRRGGSHYYALDVSDVSAPVLMWQIKPQGDFAELGQTWPRPKIAKIRFDGKERAVLVIAGGYDEGQDTASSLSADSSGRAMYIVDAVTGKRLWSAGNPVNNTGSTFDKNLPGMVNSLAATPAMADSNGDGFIDTIVAPDTGGKIWRFDINEENTGRSDFSEASVIADFSDNASAADRRRFFSTPELLVDRSSGGKEAIVVTLGSGRRPNPLDKLENDQFYVVRSTPVTGPKLSASGAVEDHTVLTVPDLLNVTSATSIDGATTAGLKKYSENGFYVDLTQDGEKVLGRPLIFNDFVVFSSYIPNPTIQGCGSNLGLNKLYLYKLSDPSERVIIELKQSGIAPRPSILIINDGTERKPVLIVGTEVIDEEKLPKPVTELNSVGRNQLIKFWLEE